MINNIDSDNWIVRKVIDWKNLRSYWKCYIDYRGNKKKHVQVDEESNELMKWVQRKFLSMFFIVEIS